MTTNRYRKKVEAMLASADILIEGNRPWDVHVTNDDIYERVAVDGMLGVGEGYMDGWWECDQLDEMICRAFRANFHHDIRPIKYLLFTLDARLRNLQRKTRAFQVGEQHYDLGDDLFRAMLDKRMIYSCAYWKDAENLNQAQENKLDLIARKLQFEPGTKVLDIGCGWGGALNYFAEKYGIEGVGITISREQEQTAKNLCQNQAVDIRLQDYRDLNEKFDRVYSVGMFEHVGYKNYRTYMQTVYDSLKPHGLFLLHSIGDRFSTNRTDPWLTQYIFPNGMLPSSAQITTASEGLLNIEDWHNFPHDYERTLMCWYNRFEQSWDSLKEHYDERFFRMWRYYLLACAGGFRAGGNQLWQIVYSRDGVPGGYSADNIR
ncbi:MAG: cyclopropane fatty acyl phospholipid synthase [Gammaproteobacteria bacterium]|nr:cyclopropane fatty acyl phospholipid synthase [Gammaproteobacteria bacterium]MCP4088301.1 cyclopropane fatty acyl phospholipid synthase [Gammaproteobacteria bacterium]MCP4276388.1 cyclopropane fatty acyl phospholipid synthase [Gammaproteobacteria bacterium]MCP4831035.1 cyclopropane fatty acyl phospholipid synthase [Gammaproteobacteria bacterium]MCP4927444.1 cyclopropane fatty acyl phospholipid synthase [Gammaproteobacteria bacterium]